MKKYIFAALFFMLPCSVQAVSLDDIYRDLVKSDNEGYLPLYVKNRHTPEFLGEEIQDKVQNTSLSKEIPSETINLINERKIKEDLLKQEQKNWEDTLNAVKTSSITPQDLAEIEKKVKNNDPKAVEIYAWILARGTGIEQNLPKSFEMYQRASLLNVPDSLKNAQEVYKAMTPEQKSQIKPLEDEEY